MKAGRALNKFLYSVSLRAAIKAKDHYYRKTMEMFNTRLVETFAGDWDEKSREKNHRQGVLIQ